MRIGIIGRRRTPSSESLIKFLSDKGEKVRFFEISPKCEDQKIAIDESGIFITTGNSDANGENLFDLDRIVFDNATYFWSHLQLRKYSREFWNEIKDTWDEEIASFRESESVRFSVFSILSEAVSVINPMKLFMMAEYKPLFFRSLQMHGIKVSPFIVSNRKQELIDFGEKYSTERITLAQQYIAPDSDWLRQIKDAGENMDMPFFIQKVPADGLMKIVLTANEVFPVDGQQNEKFSDAARNITEYISKAIGTNDYFIELEGYEENKELYITQMTPAPDLRNYSTEITNGIYELITKPGGRDEGIKI
ncbi:hypothetical protein KAI78_03985 [bacterium]|nr:hypothetical protein [bacterium]